MRSKQVEFARKIKAAFILFLLTVVSACFAQVTNVKSGVWSDLTLWSNNTLPTDTTNIVLSFDLTIDINSACKSFHANGHNVTVDSGIAFNIGIPLIGGYASSDSIATNNLIAYWPFDGDANDHKSGLIAATNGVTYSSGIRGQAYQGAANTYATLALPGGNAFSNLGSYTLSMWYKIPAEPANGDPAGLFFLTGTNNFDELINEIEAYTPIAGDSVRIHHGFNDLGSPDFQTFVDEAYDTMAINKWVYFATSYDGASSTYIIYQDGKAIGDFSAFGSNITPTQMWTDFTKTTPLGQINFSSDPPVGIVLGTWPAGLFGVSPTLGANGCFLGQMDELRIYNRALTSGEVAGLYLNGQAGR